jgi:dTDP-glucose pyrophosphorylase
MPLDGSFRDAIRAIDEGEHQIALIVGENNYLKGILTDSDVRRALLRGVPLDSPITNIMNTSPTTAPADGRRSAILATLKTRRIIQVPLIEDDGRIVDVVTIGDFINQESHPNTVVLMVGGRGNRLQPLTDDCPKPMLPIGGKPLLETIVDNFIEAGFKNIVFSVNYRSDIIHEHFGDGSAWGINISYLNEDKPLGTAGALSLIQERSEHPVIVMNGDLLTKVNIEHLLAFHYEQGADATICVREHTFDIPYGVVEFSEHRLLNLREKPSVKMFVNAGIYVIEASALDYIPTDQYFDAPQLFSALLEAGRETCVFPVREYWADIGRIDDLENARSIYPAVFG